MLCNQRLVANPSHLISVAQSTHYSVFSMRTTQPEEVTDNPRFFGKCYNFIKPLDRIQLIRKDDQVVIEYIVKSIDQTNLIANTIKLSKIDLVKNAVTYYTHDGSTEEIPPPLEYETDGPLVETAIQTRLAEFERDEKE